MASAEMVVTQEVVDLQAQPEPAAPVQPEKVNPTKRLQRRMDLLTRRWKQEQDVSRALNVLVDKYDRLTRQQRAEIKGLERDLAWSLKRIAALKVRIEKLEQTPITPHPDRYLKEKTKNA